MRFPYTIRFPGTDSLLTPQPSCPHVRQPACGQRRATTSRHSGSQTGRQDEPNYPYAHFPNKVSFISYFLLGIMLGISAITLAGCGPPTESNVLLLAAPAGLQHGEMCWVSEPNDELLKQLPMHVKSAVDSASPTQHFADNVTGEPNGLGAHNGLGAQNIRDSHRTQFSIFPMIPMSSELDSEPLTSHFAWNPQEWLICKAWHYIFTPIRPSCHETMVPLPEHKNSKFSIPKSDSDVDVGFLGSHEPFTNFSLQNINQTPLNYTASQSFGIKFDNNGNYSNNINPEDPQIPEYKRHDNSHLDLFLAVYAVAMTLHGPALFLVSRIHIKRVSGSKLVSQTRSSHENPGTPNNPGHSKSIPSRIHRSLCLTVSLIIFIIIMLLCLVPQADDSGNFFPCLFGDWQAPSLYAPSSKSDPSLNEVRASALPFWLMPSLGLWMSHFSSQGNSDDSSIQGYAYLSATYLAGIFVFWSLYRILSNILIIFIPSPPQLQVRASDLPRNDLIISQCFGVWGRRGVNHILTKITTISQRCGRCMLKLRCWFSKFLDFLLTTLINFPGFLCQFH